MKETKLTMEMKKDNSMNQKLIFGILWISLGSIFCPAQTADEIIAKNIKARGGYEKLKAIEIYSSFGTYSEFDATGKKLYTIEARSDRKLPDKKRASWSAKDINVEGAEGSDGVNPPWEFDFISGKGKLSNAEGAKASKRGVSISEPFIDYKEKGGKVKLIGKEKLEGKDVYVLQDTLPDGLEQFFYLDAKTYLVFARREATPLHAQGDPIESITFYDDYRPVNGFLFYFHHIQKNLKTGAKMAEGIDTRIEANLKLSEDWFKMPTAKTESPKTNSESEKWREDLQFLATELPKRHKNLFHKLKREDFEKAVKDLDAKIPTLTDNQIAMEFARIVAMVRDGHTSMMPMFELSLNLRAFPIKTYLFNEGFYVMSASSEYANVVGGKITKIGNTPIKKAFEMVSPYIPKDNEMGAKHFAPMYLVSPEILQAIEIVKDSKKVEFTIEKDGKTFVFEPKTTISYNEMFDHNYRKNWVDARSNSKNPIPLWIKNDTERFSFEYDKTTKVFYVQINQVLNRDDKTLAQFFQEAVDAAKATDMEKFILDLRLNGGGNNGLVPAVIRGIIQLEKIDQRGKLFVIIGRQTFSAAQNLVNSLEVYTKAIFVGEPTANFVNMYGDARRMTLPNSKIGVSVSTLWWQNMAELDRRQWTAPQVAADLTFADYANNIDSAMQAVLNYKPQKSLREIALELLQANDLKSFRAKAIEYKSNPVNIYQSIEAEINTFGYRLIQLKKMDEAIEMFKLNVELYPDSANVYDSLGDAFEQQGNKTEAIKNYEKALQITPDFPSSRDALRRLKGN